MWWLQVQGKWMLAVKWSSRITTTSIHHECTCPPSNQVNGSSDHPWPKELRAPIRTLRKLDQQLHGMSWCVNDANGIIAIGCGDNNKKKYQALKYAWSLCRSWPTDNHPARHAPTIHVDPEEYFSDDYAPPGGHTGRETFAPYAVALHKDHKSGTAGRVAGYFFSTVDAARTYFEKVKYGEWPAALLGADGKRLDHWHQCYTKKLEQAGWEWWKQAKLARPGPSQSVLSSQPARDTTDPEDIKLEVDNEAVTPELPRNTIDPNGIKLEADNEGVAMVEVIKAFFNGEEDTVENVFERMRRLLQIEQTIKQEETSTIRVPVFELGYAQKTCSEVFRCRCSRGRKLSNECQQCPTDTVDDMIQAGSVKSEALILKLFPNMSKFDFLLPHTKANLIRRSAVNIFRFVLFRFQTCQDWRGFNFMNFSETNFRTDRFNW